MKFVLYLAWAVIAAGTASGQSAGNLLFDPSFEHGGLDTPFSSHWTPFGQAHCEAKNPRTGIFSAKLFGNFKDQPNWSGIFQNHPALAGRFYEATGYFKQIPQDHLKKENAAWLKLEFYDRTGRLLATVESVTRLDAKSPSNKYMLLTTGRAQAPAGAVTARVVAIFEQGDGQAPGSAWVDDLSLRQIQ